MAIHIQNIFISAVFKKNCVCKLTTLYNQYKAYSLHKRKHAVELQNISFFTKMRQMMYPDCKKKHNSRYYNLYE